MNIKFVVVSTVGAVTGACGGSSPDSAAVERDSAGIMIVESTSPRWAVGEGWQVDSESLLDLTTSGTGPPHEFYRVRDATMLVDGSIAVADYGSQEVRVFSSNGVFRTAVGREGEGPGEFSRLTSVDRFRGDSVIAFDYWTGRVTVLDPQLEVSRIISQFSLDVRLRQLHPIAGVGFAAKIYTREFAFPEAEGLYRMPQQVVSLSYEGKVVDTLTDVLGFEGYVFSLGDVAPLFRKDAHLAVFEDRVYVGAADQMQYEVHSATGELLRIIRIPDYDLHLTADAVRRERDYLLGQLPPNAPPALREVYAALPAPESRPAYSDLRVDTEGYVWAAEFLGWVEQQNPDGTEWEVFSPVGEWLGAVLIPPRFTVFEIGVDYVLGKRRDDNDVEHVQLLRLRR